VTDMHILVRLCSHFTKYFAQ